MKKLTIIWTLLGLFASTHTLPGRAQDLVVIPRIQGLISLDGVIDEPAWQAIEPLALVMQTPRYGEPPSERTEVRIAYDEEYLYVAGRLYAAPEQVFAASFKRDLFTVATDYFGLVLDSFNDNENALVFFTTPTGGRTDWVMFNDAQEPPFPADPSWNAFWDSAVTRTEEGWFAEIRIPFSSLRFQDVEGRVVMGLIAVRFIGRKNEWITYPAIPPKWGFWSWAKPSQAQHVVFEGLQSRKPIYLTPYALSGLSQHHRIDGKRAIYRRVDDPSYDVGLDVKYGITSNLTLDLTVNTDFAQVEADNEEINLTRFSLFFPEKRPFFLERSSIFDVNVGPLDRLFYSRRIGLVDGHALPILGGARLVGRVGGWDVGVLNMQTARNSELLLEAGGLPSENLGVVRLRRQMFNPYSYAGGIATSRFDTRGSYNFLYGFDGLLRLFGDEYLSLTWAQSFDDNSEHATSGMETARLHVQWERRIVEGFGYGLSVSRSGAAFNPELGFTLRNDFTRFGDRLSYSWFAGEASPFLRHQIWLEGSAFLRNADGTVESAEFGPKWEARWKTGPELTVALLMSYEDLRHSFRLYDEADVPNGNHTFYGIQSRFWSGGGSMLRTEFTARAGTFFDGRLLSVSAGPQWTLSRHMELSAHYAYNRITFPVRDQRLGVHLGRLNLLATLNTKLSAMAFIQYSSAIDAVITNIRLRYNPTEGNDFYIVFNEGMNTDRYGVLPHLPLTGNRTIMLKYTYTFLR